MSEILFIPVSIRDLKGFLQISNFDLFSPPFGLKTCSNYNRELN